VPGHRAKPSAYLEELRALQQSQLGASAEKSEPASLVCAEGRV
jgi:hypothetical protein